MTITAVFAPIAKAILQATIFLNISPADCEGINSYQANFLENYYSKRSELAYYNDKELRAWASEDADSLNLILKKENFNIKLERFGEKGFGVVSILDVLVEWAQEGTKSKLTHAFDQKEYDAVKMKKEFSVYTSSLHNNPIVCVNTKNDDKVWMTIADAPIEGFSLLKRIEEIKSGAYAINFNYGSLRFPMVNLDQEVDISWLKDMRLGRSGLSNEYFVEQAKQQTKFKMNEKGAHVKSAVAIGIGCTSMMPRKIEEYIVNKPFLLWIERPGVSTPVFAGYISEECWQDPKNLDL